MLKFRQSFLYLQLSDFVSVVSWEGQSWCILTWLGTTCTARSDSKYPYLVLHERASEGESGDLLWMKRWITVYSTTAPHYFFYVNHSNISSHPILRWVLIKPKPREGRSAGLGAQGEREGCRFGGRTLHEWRSAGTEAKTATWQKKNSFQSQS